MKIAWYEFKKNWRNILCSLDMKRKSTLWATLSGVHSGCAGGARATREFGGSEKGQSLISAYRSLAITASTSGFEKLSMALSLFCNHPIKQRNKKEWGCWFRKDFAPMSSSSFLKRTLVMYRSKVHRMKER